MHVNYFLYIGQTVIEFDQEGLVYTCFPGANINGTVFHWQSDLIWMTNYIVILNIVNIKVTVNVLVLTAGEDSSINLLRESR